MQKGDIVIVPGMLVFSAADTPLGTVEGVDEESLLVNNRRIAISGVLRTDTTTVYLSGYGMESYNQQENLATRDALFGARPEQGLNRDTEPSQVQAGVEVVGVDEKHVGMVKSVQDGTILISRTLKRDIYIPFEEVLDASDIRVVLRMKAHEVEHHHWPEPDLHTGLGQ